MSDFLTHLIDRAAGRAPLLERRPRGLFEPAERGGAATLMTRQEEIEAAIPETAPSPRDNSEVRVPAAGAATATPGPQFAHTVQPTLLPGGPRTAIAAAPERSSPTVLRPAPLVETETRTERITTAVDAGGPQASTVKTETAAPLRAPLRTAGEGRPLQPALRRDIEQRDRPSPALAVRPQREAATALLIAKAQAVPKAPIAAAPSPPAPIQISIGRVEVRAQASTEPSQRPAATSATPRLKLEDYLRQRSGGAP